MHRDLDRDRAEQLARDMGATTVPGLVEPLREQVEAGMYDDLRHRLPYIVSRELTLCREEDRDWIQAHCLSARDDPYQRLHTFPAYSLSLKVPTDKTLRTREGAILPVIQKALPRKPPPKPGVEYHDPVKDVAGYALAVIRSIERMILGKASRLPEGSVVQGLTNHPDRERLPALDWSAEGREESLERLKEAINGAGPVFYGTGCAHEDWSGSAIRTVEREIWYGTGKRAYRSHYLDEGEAVLIGRSRKRWLSGPKWPYPRGVPVVFEGFPPAVVERRPLDFEPNPPPEDERGEPWLTVMAVAGPWIPEPDSIVHFEGSPCAE